MYLLDEIAQLASGGGEVAQNLADATIKRLSNRSPVVKQKARQQIKLLVKTRAFVLKFIASFNAMQALRLIKHVSNKGAAEYRRAICKQAKDIRSVSQASLITMSALVTRPNAT